MNKDRIIKIPYGKTGLECRIPEERLQDVITSRIESYVPQGTPEELVMQAMQNPVPAALPAADDKEKSVVGMIKEAVGENERTTGARLTLRELAKGKKNIVLIASDHTRPVPSKVIVPPMLQEIREGNPDAEITILIATGCHRGTKKEELVQKFGEEIVSRERIIVHDCDESEMVHIGTLPSGQPLIVNKIAAEADLLVAEGFIEPHFFAGYSGGRKSVLPGICAREVVLGNHNGAFIEDEHSRTGILEGNRIHEDMLYAAKAAGLKYIVNVVLNGAHEAIYAVAGDPEEAHKKGCAFLASQCAVSGSPADIVITSNGGYPLDQNVYQSVKGMTAAEAIVKQDGVIIMASKCEDGCGGDVFYKTFKECTDLKALIREFVDTPAAKTKVDQWQSQIFARVLCRARVIFISDMPDEIVRDFHMIPAHSVREALGIADEILGRRDGTVTLIPDGVSVYIT